MHVHQRLILDCNFDSIKYNKDAPTHTIETESFTDNNLGIS
jgi:hypothetical protein